MHGSLANIKMDCKETEIIATSSLYHQDWRLIGITAGVGALIAGLSFYHFVIKPRYYQSTLFFFIPPIFIKDNN